VIAASAYMYMYLLSVLSASVNWTDELLLCQFGKFCFDFQCQQNRKIFRSSVSKPLEVSASYTQCICVGAMHMYLHTYMYYYFIY